MLKFEWRWVDHLGRAMTNWKEGEPFILRAEDGKGRMYVQVRIKPSND